MVTSRVETGLERDVLLSARAGMGVLRGPFCRRMASNVNLLAAVAGIPSPTHFPRRGSLQHPHDKHQVIPSIPVLVETTPISPLSPSPDPDLGHEIRPSPITAYNRALTHTGPCKHRSHVVNKAAVQERATRVLPIALSRRRRRPGPAKYRFPSKPAAPTPIFTVRGIVVPTASIFLALPRRAYGPVRGASSWPASEPCWSLPRRSASCPFIQHTIAFSIRAPGPSPTPRYIGRSRPWCQTGALGDKEAFIQGGGSRAATCVFGGAKSSTLIHLRHGDGRRSLEYHYSSSAGRSTDQHPWR